MRSGGWLARAALLLMGWLVLSAAGEPGLHVETFGAAPVWHGPQKVQADAKGNVFLLRGDTLEVYPVLKNATLGKPVKLETAHSLNGPVIDAAMGIGPGDWLLRLPLEVRWFVDGKEKALPPLPWKPWSVAYLRGTPVVGVLPQAAPVNGMEIRHPGEEVPSTGPAVMELSGDRWSVLIEDARPAQQDANSAVESCARTVLGDHQGKLWTARNYAYVLDRYSPAGHRLLRVEVDKGKVTHRDAKTATVPAEVRAGDRASFRPFLAVQRISDLTEGLDHRIYLLVQGQTGVELDRYDPAEASLERMELGLDLTGNATLAAGRDALYLAAHSGDHGRWRISWEEVERGRWKKVMVDGEVAAPPTPKPHP
ncbi:MAG TPA: hypothetical protein VGP73_00115 [Thermoanaerobaculia bacterium]